ncbi:hypothetical protein ACPV5I_11115 [Vibrio gigantis]|uniref:hypothetical protein n=1 Tax=Vibrio sp. T20 TaxID=2588450 RepID=UPI0011B68EEA|nr:hypothetical protein [Vibrio sp. T20]
MGDWDHLHDMHNEGYSADQISDAAACGYNPYDINLDLHALGLSPKEWEATDSNFNSELSKVNPKLKVIFEDLVDNAEAFYEFTNRYLQIWGELGELYAEVNYGIKRHKPHTKGSDGKLGNDFIEIKTISPEKNKEEVKVKRAGNFNKLLIVKISSDFTFEGQLIARKDLPKGEGKHARASWDRKKIVVTKPQTVITKSMTGSPEAKIYAALKLPTYLDAELQNKLGLSESDFTKAVSELSKSQKIKRSLEDGKKWVRNTK